MWSPVTHRAERRQWGSPMSAALVGAPALHKTHLWFWAPILLSQQVRHHHQPMGGSSPSAQGSALSGSHRVWWEDLCVWGRERGRPSCRCPPVLRPTDQHVEFHRVPNDWWEPVVSSAQDQGSSPTPLIYSVSISQAQMASLAQGFCRPKSGLGGKRGMWGGEPPA